MAERVTVEHNGELITLEVPDGTTDEQIQSFLGAQTTSAQQEPTPNLAPQAASVARQVGAMAPEALGAGAELAGQGLNAAKQFVMNRPAMQTAADIAGIATHGVPWGSIAKSALTGNAATIADMSGNAINAVRQGAGALGAGARGVGSALLTGAVAPESAVMMPYQMAAYEQEKIRANPNAAGLEYNPYAQTVRGEFPTQRAAGAANQRMAVANQRYGGLTPQEQAILDKDRLNMAVRLQAAKRIIGQ